MESVPIALQVQGLAKRYSRDRTAVESLRDINMEIPLGEIWCLLGPNGSGKTTLLKILAGLLEPTEGSISILGIDPKKNPREARAKIGWMPAEERSGLYGRLSGRQNLEFFAALQEVPKKETGRIIGNLALLLDIGDELDQMLLTVSAGGNQKIGLARALLQDPPILLLDEPLRNLDPHMVMRFRRLLKNNLARMQKKTVFLSTHQLEEARRIADRIVILREGAIIKTLDAQDLEKELRQGERSVEDFYLKTVDAAETPVLDTLESK